MSDIEFGPFEKGDEYDLPPALGNRLVGILLQKGIPFYIAGNTIILEGGEEKPEPKKEVVEIVAPVEEPAPAPEPEPAEETPAEEPAAEEEAEEAPAAEEEKPKPRRRGRPRKTEE